MPAATASLRAWIVPTEPRLRDPPLMKSLRHQLTQGGITSKWPNPEVEPDIVCKRCSIDRKMREVVPKLRPDFRVRLAPDQPGHRLALTGQDMQLPPLQSCLQLAHEISRGETLMSVANGRHPAQHPQCRIVSGGIHACSSIEALMLRFRESVS